jgi:hypothetical protein
VKGMALEKNKKSTNQACEKMLKNKVPPVDFGKTGCQNQLSILHLSKHSNPTECPLHQRLD